MLLKYLNAILYFVTSSGPYSCAIMMLSVVKIIITPICKIKNLNPNETISPTLSNLIYLKDGLIFLPLPEKNQIVAVSKIIKPIKLMETPKSKSELVKNFVNKKIRISDKAPAIKFIISL